MAQHCLGGVGVQEVDSEYSHKGKIEHSPRLLFKVVLYACIRGIYTSREIRRACCENIIFMHFPEGQKALDHNTIVRFRSEHLLDVVEGLLYQIGRLLEGRPP